MSPTGPVVVQRIEKWDPTFQAGPAPGFRPSLHSLRLRLVDEARQRVVTWSDIEAESRAVRGSAG